MPHFKTSFKLPGRRIQKDAPKKEPMTCGYCKVKVEVYDTVDSQTGAGYCSVICFILRFC